MGDNPYVILWVSHILKSSKVYKQHLFSQKMQVTFLKLD